MDTAQTPALPLRPGRPRLVLAADVRETHGLGLPELPGDVVWHLLWRELPPSTVALETNLGLRVQALAFLPAFRRHDGTWMLDAGPFAEPPQVLQALPDYARVHARPFPWLAWTWEIVVGGGTWVRSRVRLQNLNDQPQTLTWAWAGVLRPLEPGPSFDLWPRKSGDVLRASVGGVHVVFYLTAGPQGLRLPYPALALTHRLEPGQSQVVHWVAVFTTQEEEGLTLARRVAATPWEALQTRCQMRDAHVPRVALGRAGEDVLLDHGRRRAWHFLWRPRGGPGWFLHLRREPETSWLHEPPRQEMPTYPQVWYWVTQYGLPALQPWVPVLVETLLQVPNPRGEPDGRPSPWGPQGRFLAHPLLVDMALRTDRVLSPPGFRSRMFPRLMAYVQRWFAPEHDADQDGWPEWEHALQMGWHGAADTPRGVPWSPWVDLRVLESPGLLALLYRGLVGLEAWAEDLNETEAAAWLAQNRERLQAHWHQAWNARRSLAPYRDRDGHHTTRGRVLWRGQGSGEFSPALSLDPPARLLVEIRQGRGRFPGDFRLVLHGRDAQGRHHTETLTPARFRRMGAEAAATSQTLWSRLDTLNVQGFTRQARLRLRTLEMTAIDLSLFLPLWAGLASPDQARRMAHRHLDPSRGLWTPSGWAWSTGRNHPPVVSLVWNVLLLEGLLRYGFWDLARQGLEALLDRLARHWSQEGVLYAQYHGPRGEGLGERETLTALPPLGLLLDMAGLRPLPGLRLAVCPWFPFPQPIVVRLWQMEIRRGAEGLRIRFPWGETWRLPPDFHGLLDLRRHETLPHVSGLCPWGKEREPDGPPRREPPGSQAG